MLIGYFMPALHDEGSMRAAATARECLVWSIRNDHTWEEQVRDCYPLDVARNRAVEWSLERGHDLLIQQDNDCFVDEASNPGPLVYRLLTTMREHDAAVVSLALPCRIPNSNGNARPNCYPAKPGETYEAETAGAGILLIDMKKLASLPQPWFRTVVSDDGLEVIEDEGIFFFKKVIAAGHKVIIDWTIPACHGVKTAMTNQPR